MTTSYNRIAGQNVEQLAALSHDAVAVTLMVFDLRAPAMEEVQSEHDLWRSLPRLCVLHGMEQQSMMAEGHGAANSGGSATGRIYDFTMPADF